ncbi:MAG: hypothetical protein GY928_38290 [Colwellia sp.]|nr:hypothetical protein [Colwellia sp.]
MFSLLKTNNGRRLLVVLYAVFVMSFVGFAGERAAFLVVTFSLVYLFVVRPFYSGYTHKKLFVLLLTPFVVWFSFMET